jgi:hypothetical protein
VVSHALSRIKQLSFPLALSRSLSPSLPSWYQHISISAWVSLNASRFSWLLRALI